jgi:hypothetical protein
MKLLGGLHFLGDGHLTDLVRNRPGDVVLALAPCKGPQGVVLHNNLGCAYLLKKTPNTQWARASFDAAKRARNYAKFPGAKEAVEANLKVLDRLCKELDEFEETTPSQRTGDSSWQGDGTGGAGGN